MKESLIMSNLILITDRYPIGKSEPFIKEELARFSLFDNIYVIPIGVVLEKEAVRKQKNNEKYIIVNLDPIKPLSILKIIGCGCFNSIFFREIKEMKKKGKITLKNLKYMMSVYAYAIERSKQVEKRISELDMNNTLIESYWMHTSALVGIKLAEKYKTQVVTRCHRCDVYEEENKYKYIPFRTYILERLDRIFCISLNAQQYLEMKYPEYQDKYELARLGTNDYGCQLFRCSKTLRLVSCSYINPVKRVDLIVETLSTINNFDITWTHYGSGEEEIKVKSLAASLLKTKKNIDYNFVGMVNHDDLMKLFLSSEYDLFINVSSSEGVPVSIMEALSFGIPVVATNVGGTSEIVHDKENGFLLSKMFDISELSNIITSYHLSNTAQKMKLRRNARAMWLNEAFADNVYEKHQKNLEGVIYESK